MVEAAQAKRKQALDYLSNSVYRPEPEVVIDLPEEAISEAADEIYVVRDNHSMNQIREVLQAALPIMGEGFSDILRNEEEKAPHYYSLARDCDLIYDALWGISTVVKGLEERLHRLKVSLNTGGENVKEEYFNSEGISKQESKNRHYVFMDSGFAGSLFGRTMNWAGMEGFNETKGFLGYLFCHGSGRYSQVNLKVANRKAKSTFKKAMKNSQFSGHTDEGINATVCAFMQLMPKHTSSYARFEVLDDELDVLPRKISLGSCKTKKGVIRKNRSKNLDQHAIIGGSFGWVNSSIIDPLTAMLLQKDTIEYFMNPQVQDRVLDKVKIN